MFGTVYFKDGHTEEIRGFSKTMGLSEFEVEVDFETITDYYKFKQWYEDLECAAMIEKLVPRLKKTRAAFYKLDILNGMFVEVYNIEKIEVPYI